MSQVVIYKGIMVEPLERSGDKIRIRTLNPGDANRAGLSFKEMDGGKAVFESWVGEDELVPVET